LGSGNRTNHPVKYEIPEAVLREMYQRMTLKQIAEHFGCGETTVWSKVKKYGIKHDIYGDLGHKHRPREFTETHRQRMSVARKGKFIGDKSTNWKGGKTQEMLRLRGSKEYQEWRKAALEMRGNACQSCGAVDGAVCECCGTRVKLHIHHVESFAAVPERRFDPANSEVLCPKCHWSRHRGKIG